MKARGNSCLRWSSTSNEKGESMTKEKESDYESSEELKKVIEGLKGRKFKLDCGHHITFGHNFGNDISIYQGHPLHIICTQCGY